LCSSLYISTAPSPSSIYTLSLHDALPILVVRGAIRANESHTFLLRRDDEIAALDLGVLQPVGVALQFAVAPPFAARVVGPLRKIRRSAVRAVEFVGPNKGPTSRGQRRRDRWDRQAVRRAAATQTAGKNCRCRKSRASRQCHLDRKSVV